MNAGNAADLLSKPDVDGGLIELQSKRFLGYYQILFNSCGLPEFKSFYWKIPGNPYYRAIPNQVRFLPQLRR
jgi:hypothetical protein